MIRIEVVHSPGPRQVLAATLSLPSPAVAGQALAAWLATPQGRASGLDAPSLASHLGVWGRRVGPDEPLRDGDRLELYRPLQCDPKESRRRRQRLAGAGACRPRGRCRTRTCTRGGGGARVLCRTG